jgi:hypothetical protein
MFLLLILHKFFEQNTHFTLQVDSNVHDIETPLYLVKEMI